LVADQAEGLRRLFVADARRLAAVMTVGKATASDACARLAQALAGMGKRVLLLDECWSMGEKHAVFGVEARHDLMAVMLHGLDIESALTKLGNGVDLLAAREPLNAPRPKMEARIGLVNAFYRLAGKYDAVLINAGLDAANSRPSYAWACQDVIIVSDGNPDAVTEVYARIKLLHQPETRRFHLVFSGLEAGRGAAVYRSIAAVSRRHLHIMPDYMGVMPAGGARGFYHELASKLQAWPVPETKAGHFPDLMRRLLRGADPHALQALLK
jgi:flagellar biosynthesis protein FlhG